MNLHPLVVHFPIALLSLYSLLEIYRRWKPSHGIKLEMTRLILLLVGVLGGRVALSTGEVIEDMFKRSALDKIVEAHESAANISITLYTILAVVVLVSVLERYMKHWMPKPYHTYYDGLVRLNNRAEKYHIWQIIAIVALGALVVTGALGGGLVYGPDVEPLTSILFKLILGH